METIEFITSAIKQILDVDASGGCNLNNFTKVLDTFLLATRTFVETLTRYPDHSGANLLGKAVKIFINLAALMFQKKHQDLLILRSVSGGRSLSTKK